MWPNPKRFFFLKKRQRKETKAAGDTAQICLLRLLRGARQHQTFKNTQGTLSRAQTLVHCWENKKWAVFNPPTVTWLLKAHRGEMSHDLSLHLPHVDICMKLNETKSKSNNLFFPLLESLWISSAWWQHNRNDFKLCVQNEKRIFATTFCGPSRTLWASVP